MHVSLVNHNMSLYPFPYPVRLPTTRPIPFTYRRPLHPLVQFPQEYDKLDKWVSSTRGGRIPPYMRPVPYYDFKPLLPRWEPENTENTRP